MIVRQTADAFQLITQPDHAALAAAIMEHSVALADHPRRASILFAVAEHDNGWSEPDAAPLIDPATGVPLDFISAPNDVRQGVWPRGVARLADDPWAAALVAQHAIVIFNRYRSEPAWTQFLCEMRSFLADGAGQLDRLPGAERLTRAELQVLGLLARGIDDATIAARLDKGEKTVRNQVSSILSKLGASTRAEAVALARDAGIGAVPD